MGMAASGYVDRKPNLYELNLFDGISSLYWTDSACIHLMTNQTWASYIVRNWFLNSPIIGSRFDVELKIDRADELAHLGTMAYNVGYNMWQGMMVKGHRHQTVGNTVVNVKSQEDQIENDYYFTRHGIIILPKIELEDVTVTSADDPIESDEFIDSGTGGRQFVVYRKLNQDSITYNNIATSINGARETTDSYEVPGVMKSNAQNDDYYKVESELQDPSHYDFRLKLDSQYRGTSTICADADINGGAATCVNSFGLDASDDWDLNANTGQICPCYNSVGGNEIEFMDNRQYSNADIGAYPYINNGFSAGTDATYWIPGRLEWDVSFPIPQDGATDVNYVDSALMFRLSNDPNVARYSVHHGPCGTGLDNFKRLTGAHNVVFIEGGDALAEVEYCWQVSMQMANGNVRNGPIWSFTYKKLPSCHDDDYMCPEDNICADDGCRHDGNNGIIDPIEKPPCMGDCGDYGLKCDLVNNQCVCMEGYTTYGDDHICVEIDLCAEAAEQGIQCEGEHQRCKNGECVCEIGYELDDENEGVCIEKNPRCSRIEGMKFTEFRNSREHATFDPKSSPQACMQECLLWDDCIGSSHQSLPDGRKNCRVAIRSQGHGGFLEAVNSNWVSYHCGCTRMSEKQFVMENIQFANQQRKEDAAESAEACRDECFKWAQEGDICIGSSWQDLGETKACRVALFSRQHSTALDTNRNYISYYCLATEDPCNDMCDPVSEQCDTNALECICAEGYENIDGSCEEVFVPTAECTKTENTRYIMSNIKITPAARKDAASVSPEACRDECVNNWGDDCIGSSHQQMRTKGVCRLALHSMGHNQQTEAKNNWTVYDCT